MNNPVMIKELRGRMRGMRAFTVLSVFLTFLSCLTVLIYLVTSVSMTQGGAGNVPAGKIVFFALFLLELFLVSFLTPALTAGAVSGERERRTFDILFSTPLPAETIVWGKFVSALAYVVALIVASLPLLGTAFLLGGVAPEEIAIAFWILLVTALAFGSVGIFFSSILKSTIASTVLTYAVVLSLTMGIPVLFMATVPFLGFLGQSVYTRWIESFLFIYSAGLVLCTNPFVVAGVTEGFYSAGKGLFFFTETLGTKKVLIVSPWMVFSALYLLGSLGLNLAAARLVRRIH